MKKDLGQCNKKVWGDRSFYSHQCNKKAKVEQEDGNFCTIHSKRYIDEKNLDRKLREGEERQERTCKGCEKYSTFFQSYNYCPHCGLKK